MCLVIAFDEELEVRSEGILVKKHAKALDEVLVEVVHVEGALGHCLEDAIQHQLKGLLVV